VTERTKPTIGELGIDVRTMAWQRSTAGSGAIEIAFTRTGDQDWVLMRLSDDSEARISVFTRFEWDCFLAGVKNGEFDDAAT
jgi:hypothetical protein